MPAGNASAVTHNFGPDPFTQLYGGGNFFQSTPPIVGPDGTIIGFPPGGTGFPGPQSLPPGTPNYPQGNGSVQSQNVNGNGMPAWLNTIMPYLGLGLLGTGLAGNIENAHAYGAYQDILSNIFKQYGVDFPTQLGNATHTTSDYANAYSGVSQIPSWYWSMAQRLGSLGPEDVTSGIDSLTRGLDQNLVDNISNIVQGQVGSRGLSDSPATFSRLMAQELAPYTLQEQQMGMQNYWDMIKAFEGVPIPNLTQPLGNPQLPPGVQPMPLTDLSSLFQMLLGGRSGSGAAGGPQAQANPVINVYGGSSSAQGGTGVGGGGMGGQGGGGGLSLPSPGGGGPQFPGGGNFPRTTPFPWPYPTPGRPGIPDVHSTVSGPYNEVPGYGIPDPTQDPSYWGSFYQWLSQFGGGNGSTGSNPWDWFGYLDPGLEFGGNPYVSSTFDPYGYNGYDPWANLIFGNPFGYGDNGGDTFSGGGGGGDWFDPSWLYTDWEYE